MKTIISNRNVSVISFKFLILLFHFSAKVVELNDALAINSTAVRLDWHLHISGHVEYIEVSIYWCKMMVWVSQRILVSLYRSFSDSNHTIWLFIELQGLYIRFRDLGGGSQNYNIMTVMSPTSQNYIVGNLKKFTKYEFFVAPFYRSVEGQPSNSKIVQTFEDGKWM